MVLFSFLEVEEGIWQYEENSLLGEMLQGDYGGVWGKWSTVCLFIRGDFDKNYRLFRWVRLSVRMNCQEGIT